MIHQIENFINTLDAFVWGVPLMVLLIGTGFYLTILLRGVQLRGFFHGFDLITGKYDRATDPGEVSHFKALSTALSATVGTGNIVGVATAIVMGGPGALFWMWVTALVGMATKFTCCTLSVHYRNIDKNGEVHGGPMYYIEKGLGKNFKWLACFFATFTTIASLGIGNMFQSNNVASAVNTLIVGYDGAPLVWVNYAVGIISAVVAGLVIIGGIKRIANFSSFIAPFMCIFYVIAGFIIMIKNFDMILPGLKLILVQAFSAPESMQGGLLGGVIKSGVARGLFSNEAGMGSAPIAHGAARTKEPVREGLVAMLGPFIDTIVVCSITGLVIVCTGAFNVNSNSGRLTTVAFNMGLPGTGWMVSLGIILFAYSTIISWSYYGDRAIDYLLGKKAVLPYRMVYVFFVFVGAVANFPVVINFCDSMNGLMAVPNLIALLVLSPIAARLAKDYFGRLKQPNKIAPAEAILMNSVEIKENS